MPIPKNPDGRWYMLTVVGSDQPGIERALEALRRDGIEMRVSAVDALIG